jgi:mannose-6-phosphate isomerase-like protein (cupin superfamily)
MQDIQEKTQLKTFSVKGTPLLSSGSTMNLVARAPSLWMHIKVYADGGENTLHAHPKEDHIFFVLQGEATFLDRDGEETVVAANEGVTVPRNTLYSFRASGNENLVLLRVGCPTEPELAEDSSEYPGVPKATLYRNDRDGAEFGGDRKENKTGAVKGVPSGELFAA